MSDVENKIADLERTAVSLSEKNSRLSSALAASREELATMKAIVEQVSEPPSSFAIFEKSFLNERHAQVVAQGRRLIVAVAPQVALVDLQAGQQVRLNERMVLFEADDYPTQGDVVVIAETLADNRVLVKPDGTSEKVLALARPLHNMDLNPGDTLLADLRTGHAFELLVRAEVEQLLVPEVPHVPYSSIGGLSAQIEQIRDALELPFAHPELYARYGLKAPKGVLLYGPPGCGKTLIAKAVATSLAETARGNGKDAYFLSIKGPELLNKFVGETERQIRAIFNRARELASEDAPVVIFFDEMEALFRTRGSGISSDVENMVVPQFLAEMDGVEQLDNVVVIGASNREDMIDPAVLRPGRLDVKIRIERPDAKGAAEILRIYLDESLPYATREFDAFGSPTQVVQSLIARTVNRLYATAQENALFHITYVSGRESTVYLGDMVTGAFLASIVERAKKAAIKDQLQGKGVGISAEHLLSAVTQEAAQTASMIATTSPDEWSRVIGHRSERIVDVTPLHGATGGDPQ